MLKNYWKIALRHLTGNKAISFINIIGLTLGMTAALLLMMSIRYITSTDRFHKNIDNIFMAYTRLQDGGSIQCTNITAGTVGPALKKEFPEVTAMSRMVANGQDINVDGKITHANGLYVDPAYLDIFTYPLLSGDAGALTDPHSILLTDQLAKRIFGNIDPIGNTLILDNKDPLTVKGVLKDPPRNTENNFEFLLPYSYGITKGLDDTHWNHIFTGTYVQLAKNTNLEAFNKKIRDVSNRHDKDDGDIGIFVYPFSRVHLYGRFVNGKPDGGNIDNVRLLGILTIILLGIACINFMNLSTARSERRAKEVGVRKVIGAGRPALIAQFIGESILFAAIAGALALLIANSILPVYSQLTRNYISIDWQSPVFWLSFIGFILFTGVLAGSYPAFYLSSFKPTAVLKGIITNGKALVTPRKILVITQFVLAIVLINFTLIFRKQIRHTQDRPLGFVTNNLVFQSQTSALAKNYDALKNELLGSGVADAVTRSSNLITDGGSGVSGLVWPGIDKEHSPRFETIFEQGDFIKTNGLQLVAGRDIDIKNHPEDTTSCLFNETAIRMMGFKQPLGQILPFEGTNFKIIGVVKDVLIGSANQATSPLWIRGNPVFGNISIRLSGHNPSLTNITNVENIIKKYNTGFVTEIQFADEHYENKFREAKNVASVINGFALVAIFISCMGLLGLSIYMAENRTREIGIRKVLGAGTRGITLLLVRDFIRLLAIAIIIASPIAWFAMNAWLHQYSYRTSVSVWILFLSGGSALLIAAATVSVHSIKAAIAPPVKSLRTE